MNGVGKTVRWFGLVAAFAAVFASGLVVERAVTNNGRTAGDGVSLFPQAYALEAVTEDIPGIVEKVVPAVVNISSKKVVKSEERTHPFFSDPFFRRFFGDDMSRFFNIPRERIERNLGSGVIITEDGYILTNNHLVEQADEVAVVLPDMREFDAKIIGTDPRTDVAVLKIEAEQLPVVPIGDAAKLRLGQTVLAIGYPFGIGQTVTRGIISALGRTNLNLVDYENFIQTDAAINPGNSGGALINTNGELIGINTAILSSTGRNMGIGFAIPIDLASSVMESIIHHGRVIRGYLGVWLQNIDPQMAEEFGLEEPRGVIVSEVKQDGPAAKGGIEAGDVVLTYNGTTVNDMNQFRNLVSVTAPGTEVKMEIFRDGKKRQLSTEISEFPGDGGEEEAVRAEEAASPLLLGLGLETLSDYHRSQLDIPSRVHGVIITEVDPSTPAGESGLARGDVILEMNREPIENLDDLNDVISRSGKDRYLLFIYRGGRTFYRILKD
ncbi:MAG TPA: DegQ family serine endoprotease [Patescibacteria group bacterium]|nr:DegQ family serine endoprotease [Patescibacteria group bacterium]